MTRFDGTVVVAYWLIASGVIALLHLVARSASLAANPAGWHAAAGPLVVAVAGLVAARQLFRPRCSIRLAAVVLGSQMLSLSIGPLAYRLDAGPFLRLSIAGNGVEAGLGSDARMLFILGAGNRVPPGVAINLLALAALLVLVAAHRSRIDSVEA